MINLFGLLQDMCSTSNLVNPSFNMFYLETTYMIELTTFQSKDKFILKMKKKQKNVFLVIGCIIWYDGCMCIVQRTWICTM